MLSITRSKPQPHTCLKFNTMLPDTEQVNAAAAAIAKEIHSISTISGRPAHIQGATLLVDDIHGIYVPMIFCRLYAKMPLTHDDHNDQEFDDFFEELITAINEHTPEPYAVFWHEGGLWYGNESQFFDEWHTAPDTTPADTNQEPF